MSGQHTTGTAIFPCPLRTSDTEPNTENAHRDTGKPPKFNRAGVASDRTLGSCKLSSLTVNLARECDGSTQTTLLMPGWRRPASRLQ